MNRTKRDNSKIEHIKLLESKVEELEAKNKELTYKAALHEYTARTLFENVKQIINERQEKLSELNSEIAEARTAREQYDEALKAARLERKKYQDEVSSLLAELRKSID